VDHQASPALVAAAERMLGPEGICLVFDFSECYFMDSGGIAVLLALLRRLRQRGWLGVIAPDPHLLRIFEIVGLTADANFRIFPSEAELPV
jgi:anti-anti-sigma factor